MKSPFPGMDPFIESSYWQDFHISMIVEIKKQLAPQLPSHYQLTAELNVETKNILSGNKKSYRADLGVIDKDRTSDIVLEEPQRDYSVITQPAMVRKLKTEKQRFLALRDAKTRELVTAIEVLSPTNKEKSGLSAYQLKRRTYIQSGTGLLEIDLLRGGTQPYKEADWPVSPYQVILSEYGDTFTVWTIGLDEQLPTVPVPLAYGESPLVLNLQEVFREVYSYGSYDTDYNVETLVPQLSLKELKVLSRFIPVDFDN